MKNYGISFNSFTIANEWNLNQKYYLLEIDEQSSPNRVYMDFIVPKRDGSKTIKNRYENKFITVKIEIRGRTVQDVANNTTELLEKWLGVEGKLFLLKKPNKFYEAEILDGVQKEETTKGTFELTITFKCSPVMYEIYGDLRDYIVDELTMIVDKMTIVVNKSVWDDVSEPCIKQIANDGNYRSQPVIEIRGTASLLTMQIADTSFSIINVNGSIFIDSEKMIVYKIENNRKVSCLQQFRGQFPIIPIRQSDVIIGGTNLNLGINVEFKNTYIV